MKSIAVRRFPLVLLAILAAPRSAHAIDDPAELAQRFLKAFSSRNSGSQAILAAQPAGEAPYALSVQWLLLRGHGDAAKALVAQRRGPEREGLQRLLEVGVGASAGAYTRLGEAQKLLAAGKKAEASLAVAALERVPGSVFSAMLSWTRARLLAPKRGVRSEKAALACLVCVEDARACGWLARARDAARLAARWAANANTRIRAANEWVELCKLLDDSLGRLAALDRRAVLHLTVAKALGDKAGDDAARLRERARADWSDAIALAQQRGKVAIAARLTARLAQHWHFDEGRIKAARVFYEKAETLLDAADDHDLLPKVRRNLAVVLTQLGQYGAALERLDKLLAGAEPPYDAGQRAALAQRAYALWRRGSTERATAAYAQVLAVTEDPAGRARIRVEAGELQLQRGDLEAAREHFDAVLKADPDHVEALVSRARARGLGGDEKGALEDFRVAFEAAGEPRQQIRVLLFRAQQQRSWGRVEAASQAAQKALAIARETKTGDPLDVGVTWLLNADLQLLRGDRKAGLEFLAHGGALFVRLGEPINAAAAYAREVLLFTDLGRSEEALQRLSVLRHLAATTPIDALKSLAFGVESYFEARAGRLGKAGDLARKALAHARSAGDREREANALLQLARLKKKGGYVEIEAALDALDARLTAEPEWHPAIDGERPGHAAGIGLSILIADENLSPAKRAQEGYRLIERARRERLLLALRGRLAVLRRTLEPDAFREFLRHRNAVRQAQAEKSGVEEAEAVFGKIVEIWRDEKRLPGMALTFPRRAKLEELQAKLTDGDVFLDLLDDPYARVMLVATKTTAALRAYDDKSPAAAAAAELKAATRVIVAPDGRWAVQPFPIKGKPVLYATSGSSFPGGPARTAAKVVSIPDAIALDFDAPRATPAHAELHRRPSAPLVVASGTRPARAARSPRAEGATALVEALAARGAHYVAISLHGAPPAALLERFLANCRDRGQTPPTALWEAQQWFLARNPAAKPTQWASLVLYRTG